MFNRSAGDVVRRLSAQGNILLLVGARGVGKTSLARAALPSFRHLDAGDPEFQREFFADPLGALPRIEHPTIIDNAECLPKLFETLAWHAGHRPGGSPLVVLSSVSPVGLIGSSLEQAPGLSIVEIGGLATDEVFSSKPTEGWRQLWLRGGTPRAFLGSASDWHGHNLRCVAAEISSCLRAACTPGQVVELVRELSLHHGQTLFLKKTMDAVGLPRQTVLQVIDALVDRFLIRLLHGQPADGDDHVGRMPRIYFRDTGLLHTLWGVHFEADLDAHPMRHESWEGFVLEESLRHGGVLSGNSAPYFVFRDTCRRVIPIVTGSNGEHSALFPHAGITNSQAFRSYEKRALAFGCRNFQVVDFTVATWGIPRVGATVPSRRGRAAA